jgi:hypothetical protein
LWVGLPLVALLEPDWLPPTSVTAVTESGLTTIMTGLPSLSFALTKKELGITLMSVKPAAWRFF